MSKMQNMMDIKFDASEKTFIELQDLMNDIGEPALYLSHYELADVTGTSPIAWKEFLTDIRVSTFIASELELIKKSKVANMLKDVNENKSTGQAQLLNTLLNQTKQENVKEGPVFVYTYIPLNDDEKKIKDVHTL